MTSKQRSEVARKAALAAHKTMASKGYIAAKKKSPQAVAKFLANRSKAA
jgi:hypothetical protein